MINNMCAQEIQNWLIATSIFVSAGTTFYLQCKAEKSRRKAELDRQLIELQNLAVRYPFLEDGTYADKWDEQRENMLSGNLPLEERDKFLQYDAYTELLFNYVSRCLNYYRKEKKLLEYVDFKGWLRPHKKCWEKPLQEHSNREVYGDRVADMIDRWMK